MMNIRNPLLLLVLLTMLLGACGTFELESDVLSEAQVATATPANTTVAEVDPGASPTPSVSDSAAGTDSPTTSTLSDESVAEVRITDVTVALGDTVSEHLRVTATGELTSNCFSITGWAQSVVGDRLVAEPIVAVAGQAACDGAPRAFAEDIVMDQHGFSLEQLAGGSLMLDVAGEVQPLRTLLAPLFSNPDPTTVPTPEPQIITTEAFEQMLQEAISSHDYEWMAQLMDDPFDFALWQSQGYTAPAAQAVNDLRHIFLPPDQDIVFGAPLPILTPVLGPGNDILDIWNPAANAVSAVFTTGWGPDGITEAFLIISATDEGILQWDGIIFAAGELGGFDGPHDGQVISAESFEQMLEEAITSHNYEWMAQLMDDPFDIALWQSQGYTAEAAQAVNDLRNTYLPPGQTVIFGAPQPDLTPVLGPGRGILDIWNPAANAVSAIFTTGWGPDGTTEAFLIVSLMDTGALQWDGIIFASGDLGGFDGE